MPVYCYKCRTCGATDERLLRTQDLTIPQRCPSCDSVMVRDFKTESATNNFHPTVDLYANAKKLGKKRGAE